MAKILGYYIKVGSVLSNERPLFRYYPLRKYKKARFLRKAQRMQKYITITPWTSAICIGMR